MTQKELVRRVSELTRPLCGEAGVSLWDVTFEKEGKNHVLTIFIDREEGVNIQDCEAVSRALDPLLDAREFDSLPPYTLTVSSAGLERPLTRPEHFAWARGRDVVAGFYRAIDGQSEREGKLLDYDGVQLTLDCGGERVVLAMADVARVRLAFVF